MRKLETAFMAQFCVSMLLRLHQVNKYLKNVEIGSGQSSPNCNLQSLVKFFIKMREQFDLYKKTILSIQKRKYIRVMKSVLFSGNFHLVRHLMVKIV